MELQNIPEELKKLKQWVFWKNVDGVKYPYRTRTVLAKVNDSNTWMDYRAVRPYKEYGMTGIGFVLTAEDPFTIIDLDKCLDHRVPMKFSLRVVEYFKSYTEISPSGNGLHIVVKGKIPEAIKRFEIEIYSKKRYMAFTGDLVWNFPIRECQNELDKVFEKYKPKPRQERKYHENKNSKFTMPNNLSVTEGNRNNELARWCGIIKHKVTDMNEYLKFVCQINDECFHPRLKEYEALAVAKSIWRTK